MRLMQNSESITIVLHLTIEIGKVHGVVGTTSKASRWANRCNWTQITHDDTSGEKIKHCTHDKLTRWCCAFIQLMIMMSYCCAERCAWAH
jgi:hypothetical protein